MGNIGEVEKRVELEPVTVPAPVTEPEQVPVPAPEPEPVPA